VGAHWGCLLCAANLQAAADVCLTWCLNYLWCVLCLKASVAVVSVGLSGHSWQSQPEQFQNPSMLAASQNRAIAASAIELKRLTCMLSLVRGWFLGKGHGEWMGYDCRQPLLVGTWGVAPSVFACNCRCGIINRMLLASVSAGGSRWWQAGVPGIGCPGYASVCTCVSFCWMVLQLCRRMLQCMLAATCACFTSGLLVSACYCRLWCSPAWGLDHVLGRNCM
jgi:hypothetical protein